MMSETKIVFLTGLPRSGKSSLCKELVKNPEPLIKHGVNIGLGLVWINVDDIRVTLSGKRFDLKYENDVFITKFQIIDTLLRTNHSVMVDDTHSSLHNIYPFLWRDPNALCIRVWSNAKACKERAIETNQLDVLPVIDRIEQNLIKLEHEVVPTLASLRRVHYRSTGNLDKILLR